VAKYPTAFSRDTRGRVFRLSPVAYAGIPTEGGLECELLRRSPVLGS
jgi:hypothetical protein